jgi:hypothetical protein
MIIFILFCIYIIEKVIFIWYLTNKEWGLDKLNIWVLKNMNKKCLNNS